MVALRSAISCLEAKARLLSHVPLLIDAWMPHYGANEIHDVRVNAAVGETYAAVLTANLADSWIVRTLLTARGVPGAIMSGQTTELYERWNSSVSLRSFEEAGFRILEERDPEEVVIGLEGRFWTASGGIRRQDPDEFRKPIPAGVVRAVWNFTIIPVASHTCELRTETRIGWTDQEAGRSFLRYWRFVAPWSGLTRRLMLRAIRVAAEERIQG